ncbi:NAD(P)H-dependent oxidoreductase [Roseiarcaceae bacterium H3SJ34-1]|uniref:NAD(P)H-dependent oxidoreductase n=1 Tax=Terripilifer ovatus TaxID=3032367 RepID=UPI003AB9B4B1|nr:NAD(P)H-dependent oxidoreductase [Roseiarcaceae bacterium H3SJ34-1]
MPRRILLIQGHPDPDRRRFCRALAGSYAKGARDAGHSVEEIDLATVDFPLLRSELEFEHGCIPESLRAAEEAIRNAEHVVLVFPLWLGTMPALVKGFLEQVMRPGVAFAYRQGGFPEKLMAGRSARVVVTMGMPTLLYRWWYGANGTRVLKRNILEFTGFHPVRETLFGMVADAGKARRMKWLDRMYALGRKAS